MQAERRYHVYIMASRRNGTLYVGFSGAILRRVWEHKNDVHEGFTKKYGVHQLVWYEGFDDVDIAIAREKQLKGWNRAWKIKLINRLNPSWDDLFEALVQGEGYSMKPIEELVASFLKKIR